MKYFINYALYFRISTPREEQRAAGGGERKGLSEERLFFPVKGYTHIRVKVEEEEVWVLTPFLL